MEYTRLICQLVSADTFFTYTHFFPILSSYPHPTNHPHLLSMFSVLCFPIHLSYPGILALSISCCLNCLILLIGEVCTRFYDSQFNNGRVFLPFFFHFFYSTQRDPGVHDPLKVICNIVTYKVK